MVFDVCGAANRKASPRNIEETPCPHSLGREFFAA
jgi:hypothetical protein